MRFRVRPAFWQPACVDTYDHEDRKRVRCLTFTRHQSVVSVAKCAFDHHSCSPPPLTTKKEGCMVSSCMWMALRRVPRRRYSSFLSTIHTHVQERQLGYKRQVLRCNMVSV